MYLLHDCSLWVIQHYPSENRTDLPTLCHQCRFLDNHTEVFAFLYYKYRDPGVEDLSLFLDYGGSIGEPDGNGSDASTCQPADEISL